MSQIQKEIKTHVIIFVDGSEIFVSGNIAERIMRLSTTSVESIEIDGNFYKFKMISKILSRPDYYDQYPDKRAPEYRRPSRVKSRPISWTAKRRLRALRQMLVGIGRYINGPSCKGTETPKEIRNKIIKKIKETEVVDPETPVAPPI